MIIVLNLIIMIGFIGILCLLYKRLPRALKGVVLAILFVLFGVPALIFVGKPIAKALFGPSIWSDEINQ